jgi:hypothetical protein
VGYIVRPVSKQNKTKQSKTTRSVAHICNPSYLGGKRAGRSWLTVRLEKEEKEESEIQSQPKKLGMVVRVILVA